MAPRVENAPRSNKGVGACFVEVEVDTWTGNWRFVRAVYTHDTGLVINPLVSESDMVGSLVESTQVATDPIPWDREFPGTRHYSVGYLSYRLPTIMDIPKVDAGVHRQPGAALVLRREELQRNQHRRRAGRDLQRHLQRLRRQDSRASDHARKDHGRPDSAKEAGMKKISIYRPTSVDEAIQILSQHGTEARQSTPAAPTC